MLPVLVAVTGAPWESTLVGRLDEVARGRDQVGLVVVRRCVDIADLLATAATGTALAALVWPGLRRLDGSVMADLSGAGVAVIGVVAAGEDASGADLRRRGFVDVVDAESSAQMLATRVADAVTRTKQRETGAVAARPAIDAAPIGPGDADQAATDRGRLIAVWGPTGGPGRTTVAVTVASELARRGVSTLLADADVYGGVVAEHLAIVDEAPGLAAAARAANSGSAGVVELAAITRQIEPNLRVLTGLPRADRWPELRPAALATVWSQCRDLAAVTVVDCGFCLEQDEELSFDTSAPRRNGATLVTLEAADSVCVVGTADPIGVLRLVRAIDELRAAVPGVSMHVVVNRLRSGAIGSDAVRQITEVVERHAGVRPVAFVPYDSAGLDAALATGRVLADAAPGSPARAALAALATTIAGGRVRERGRRRRALIRRTRRRRG